MLSLRRSNAFRIAFIPTQNAGVNYYRMAAWAFEMRKYKGVEAAMFAFQYGLNDPHPWQKDFLSNPAVRSHINSLCDVADIVIWHPVHYDFSFDFFLEMRQKHDKPFLVETDDNFIDVPPWNEAFHSFSPNSFNRKVAVNCMRAADGLIVSTPHLREIYTPFNENVHVIENSLDFRGDRKFIGWDKVSVRKHKGTRIGWIGGRSHFNDLMMVAPALHQVLQEHHDVTLCLVNSALKPSCAALGKPYPFEGLRNVHYADRSAPINRYAPFAASFGFDIGIAPLVDCNFNRSKSNLRWLEMSALHVPTVASDISHFKQTIGSGRDGFLVKDNDLNVWVQYLKALISMKGLREDVGRKAYERIKDDFNLKTNAAKYVRLLKSISEFDARASLDEADIPEMAEAI
jgi:glycosyltransferase involved in cell wall biosynthesis